LQLFLQEAGQILPVTWAMLGWNGVGLPVLVAHPAVIAFLQGTVLVFSVFLSWVLTHKIARHPLKVLWPQHSGILILGAGLWQLIV
jgi:hypothetical protein